MTVEVRGGEARIYRLSIPIKEFPDLLAQHHAKSKKKKVTNEYAELLGNTFVRNGFPLNETEAFVKAVCQWGNYPGIAGKVRNHNTWRVVRKRMKDAYLASSVGKSKKAIETITKIIGLDISFGSKHLKFLDPDGAVVLDSIISTELGFPRDPDGYVDFLEHCRSVRNELNRRRIAADRKKSSSWRVADVEMAIFMHLIS